MYNETIEGRDIIVVGQQPWDVEIGSNCKNIAIEFSKRNRVLYVNSPLDRITAIRDKKDPRIQKRLQIVKRKEKSLLRVGENIWNLYPDNIVESINWISNHALFNYFNRRNNKLLAESVLRAVKELNFENFILFNDNDIFKSFYLKELLEPQTSIYYSRDFMLGVDYWKKHGERLEPELIRKSDLCVANSTYLADYCSKYNSSSFYVGQGCDLTLFDSTIAPVPEVLKAISNPIIGYVGFVSSSRLDISILEFIALNRPEWNIVLVGSEDEAFKQSTLHELKNVYFLGHQDPENLPRYINGFDVCINPQLLNEITIGNYPRKIDEYLAMGKATVATKTRAMEIFRDHTYLADTKEEYLELIEKALREDSEEKQGSRKEFAATHTWENNVKEIYKAINLTNNQA